jgi:hypothetical protein
MGGSRRQVSGSLDTEHAGGSVKIAKVINTSGLYSAASSVSHVPISFGKALTTSRHIENVYYDVELRLYWYKI